jgi:hypothetical protein
MGAGHEVLKKLGYAPERQADCLKLSVAHSHEALSIVNQVGSFLGF